MDIVLNRLNKVDNKLDTVLDRLKMLNTVLDRLDNIDDETETINNLVQNNGKALIWKYWIFNMHPSPFLFFYDSNKNLNIIPTKKVVQKIA